MVNQESEPVFDDALPEDEEFEEFNDEPKDDEEDEEDEEHNDEEEDGDENEYHFPESADHEDEETMDNAEVLPENEVVYANELENNRAFAEKKKKDLKNEDKDINKATVDDASHKKDSKAPQEMAPKQNSKKDDVEKVNKKDKTDHISKKENAIKDTKVKTNFWI